MTQTFPTEVAWAFFMTHHADIRACCERFLPVPEFQIPNTRVVLVAPDGSEMVTERRAAMSLPVTNLISDFDAAVRAKDAARLTRIMNDAWIRAPESRRVYDIPGFSAMCDLLDGTVDGFFDPGGECDE
jgi:hypothetical protein